MRQSRSVTLWVAIASLPVTARMGIRFVRPHSGLVQVHVHAVRVPNACRRARARGVHLHERMQYARRDATR